MFGHELERSKAVLNENRVIRDLANVEQVIHGGIISSLEMVDVQTIENCGDVINGASVGVTNGVVLENGNGEVLSNYTLTMLAQFQMEFDWNSKQVNDGKQLAMIKLSVENGFKHECHCRILVFFESWK